MIHTDVLYEHYRNLGLEAFLEFPLTAWVKKSIKGHFSRRLERAQACTRCGLCEEQCPHGVPIVDLLEQMLENHPPLIEAARARGWEAQYADAVHPYPSSRRKG
jgi:Fe-S oxidoreductase